MLKKKTPSMYKEIKYKLTSLDWIKYISIEKHLTTIPDDLSSKAHGYDF